MCVFFVTVFNKIICSFVQIVFLCVPVLMLVRSVKLFFAVGRGVLVLSAMSVRFIVIHFATVAINVKTAMVVELMKIIFVLLVGNNLYLKKLSQSSNNN